MVMRADFLLFFFFFPLFPQKYLPASPQKASYWSYIGYCKGYSSVDDNILTKTTSVFSESVMAFNVLTWRSLQLPGPALPSQGFIYNALPPQSKSKGSCL